MVQQGIVFTLVPRKNSFLTAQDTEGSFVIERVVEIAEAVVEHLNEMTADKSKEEQRAASSFTVNEILSHIFYYRVHDYVEQIAMVNILPRLLHEYPQVGFLFISLTSKG